MEAVKKERLYPIHKAKMPWEKYNLQPQEFYQVTNVQYVCGDPGILKGGSSGIFFKKGQFVLEINKIFSIKGGPVSTLDCWSPTLICRCVPPIMYQGGELSRSSELVGLVEWVTDI